MGHFSVLVVASDLDEVNRLLAPYDETDESLFEFVPVDGDVVEEARESLRRSVGSGNSNPDTSLEAWTMWERRGNVYGVTANPLEKYDYFVVGGRWQEALVLKPGREGLDISRSGYQMICYGNATSALAGDVDWEKTGPTFAWVDEAGWHASAEMGWWAVTRNEDQDYDRKFFDMVSGLDPAQRVYVVDCHV
jgi:hypothetical protein